MRFRPQTWLLLSVLLFLAGGYAWHLADQRQARLSAPKPVSQPAPAKTSGVQLSPQTKPSLLANLAGQSGPPAAAKSNSVAAARAERLRYRLTNTKQTVGQLARRDHAILLENALIDTDQPLGLAIPAQLQAQGDPGAYIVQARGPLNDAFRALLRDAGAEIISYIPNNAYLVRASAAAVQQLAAQAQSVLPYEPYYKLKSDLLPLAVNQAPLPPDSALNLTVFPGSLAATEDQLKQLGAEVVGEDRSPFGPVLKVRAPAAALVAVAQLRGVQEVELLHKRTPANDLSRVILGISPDTTSTTNDYMGLTGNGVTVAVSDSGVDAMHPDFGSRVLGDVPASINNDTVGHGTHVAGIIAADGTKSDTVTNSQGSINPGVVGQYRGKAPKADIFSLGIDFGNPFIPDSYLQQTTATNSAYGTNVFISNNSWGFPADNSYSIVSASYDAAVRDSLPGVTGSQPIVYVFAAGNDGQGTTGGLGDDSGVGGEADTISAPATAKNVISVGATELPRNVTNTVEFYSDGIGTDTNGNPIPIIITNIVPVFLGMTDSSNEVASFSSRGNVGIGVEGDFGRFKPDVVAPGSFVVSTRSEQWDQNAYYNPTNIAVGAIFNTTIPARDRFDDFLFIPENATYLKITLTNLTTGLPLTNNVEIFADANTQPATTFRGNNQATLNFPADGPSGAIWFFSLINTNEQPVTFDVLLQLAVTNQNDLLTVLSNMNNGVGPWYRYESGTSMAAPAVSGVLALIQEFFEKYEGGRVSPAMMKALLINGARTANSDIYDLQVQNGINYQGWGLVNLPNCLPSALTNNPAALTNLADFSPIKIFDQDTNTALATGQSQTRTITINSDDARNQPLRVTLVWTDPPGNPAAGIKLVNDLDLIVTNLTDPANPVVYFGNDIGSGRTFSQRWDTNSTPNVDFINNVENIYLQPPLGSNYTITVAGRRVNVNAVTAQTNTAQDYALVVSAGDGSVSNAITVTDLGAPAFTADLSTNAGDLSAFPLVTIDPDGVPLLGQRAGANSPLVGTGTIVITNVGDLTLGASNQWHFYVFTNTGVNSLTGPANATNVAFITFLPPTLAVPREGVFQQGNVNNASRPEADIDLYVSTDPGLLNLDPTVMSAAANNIGNNQSSLTRSGTEFVVYTNSHLGDVYYIGVHAEDRQAANYGFFGIATDVPFSQDNGNSVTVHGMPPRPVVIPDGTPTLPGSALMFGIVPNSVKIRRVVVTNDVSHELFGDLFGNLEHSGSSAVLNNHTAGDNSYSNHLVYEDNGEGDIPGSRHSDGPGNLKNFIGAQASGVWLLTMVDNSQYQTGQVDSLTMLLEKSQDTNDLNSTLTICKEIFTDSLEVGPEATNLTFNINLNSGGGPVSLYVRRDTPPTLTTFDYLLPSVVPPGGQLVIDRNSVPPLEPGTYFFTTISASAQCFQLQFIQQLDANASAVQEFLSAGDEPIRDDAVTDSSLLVTNTGHIVSTEVGLRIDHPRVSDLAITLVSPAGTRVLLAENRGGTTTEGYGATLAIASACPAPSTATGWTQWPKSAGGNDHWYKAVATSGLDWDQVNVLANNECGYLATITSPAENAFVFNLVNSPAFFQSFNGAGPALGGIQPPGSPEPGGGWSWVTGEPWSYTDWAPGDPNNGFGPNENRLQFWSGIANTPGPTWNDVGEGDANLGGYVVEREVASTISYAVFTEDPAKDPTPIKFAIPPFHNTSSNALSSLLISDFETNAPGSYPAGTNVDGWDVLQNPVLVATNPPANTGTNFLKLLNGEIVRSLPTTNVNHQYLLSFAYRGITNLDPIAWWPGDDNPNDIIGNNNGQLIGGTTYTNGEVNDAFYFPRQGAFIKMPTSSLAGTTTNLNVGTNNGFTVECWINPTDVSMTRPLVNWSSASVSGVSLFILPGGFLFASLYDINNNPHFFVEPVATITTNVFQHVALTYDKLSGTASLYDNGAQVFTTFIGSFTPSTATPDLYFGLNSGGGPGFPTYLGSMDEIGIYAQALSAAQIQDIYQAGSGGKCATVTPPTKCGSSGAFIQVPGAVMTLVGTTNWQTTSIVFTATSPGTLLDIRPATPGTYSGASLDTFTLADLSSDVYYLPEESLDKLKGESAFGQWTLELWDNRAGMPAPADSLLSWKLSFVLDNLAASRPANVRLPVIATNLVVNEMTLLTVVNTATPGTPGDSLVYALQNPPAGAVIDANGNITWMPTEIQGPGTNIITTVVTEFGLSPSSATNSFTVIVNEVNRPPVLPPDSIQTAFVGEDFVLDNSATDPDIPVNPLTYAVTVNPPAAWLNPDTNAGLIISGTPAAGDVGSYTVTTVVTDFNLPAVNAKSFSVTNFVQITVTNFLGTFATNIPAAPGAGGAGGTAVGGRGGDVYHVTNLNDSGPGSLRNGVTSSHRTIVFDVSGTIHLLTDLKISRPYLTIAGQTAPGDGITLADRLTSVQNTHDVIVRYLRCRPGDTYCPDFQDDAFHFNTMMNSIADHITATWSIDEALSVTHSTNITIQWCMIAEPLNDSCHANDSGAPGTQLHGYESLLRYGYGTLSFNHNLYAHNYSRNPRLGDNLTLDFVNNVIYNWGDKPGYSGTDAEDLPDDPAGRTNFMNYVGNYLVAGGDSAAPDHAFEGGTAQTWIYQTNNIIDSNLNLVFDGIDTGWGMFIAPLTQVGAPFVLPPPAVAVIPEATPVAFERVLAFAGANQKRDAVDLGIINDVRNQTGHIINSQTEVGGWPVLNSAPLPLGPDTDNDGLPDDWELTFGLDPNNGLDGNFTNALGYTRLEEYLNWMADPHAIANTNEPVDIDLQALAGNTGDLSFSVLNGTNGLVFLLPDGHTARFTPATDFGGGTNFGLASFGFYVTNNFTTNSFGPVDVNVLVSKVHVATTTSALPLRIFEQSTNSVRLEWDGTSNEVFDLLWTTNVITALSNWGVISNTVVTPFIFTNNVWSFTDDGSQTGGFNSQRFYRLLLP